MTTEDLPCELPIRDATMHLVHGRRCLLIPSRKVEHRNTNLNTSHQSKEGNDIQPPPPIVILGGMAQCIESWQHHFQDFSRERDVLMYEYCGSGMQGPQVESLPEDDAYYKKVDLNSHADDFQRIVRTIFEDSAQFDVVAFSLGGRIALNTIASNPVLIRRAHITGVSAEREAMAKIILKSWHDLLSQEEDGSLKAFAWSIILSTYSDSFLAMNGEKRISSWVDHICSNQRRLGLLRLLQQTGNLEPLELVDPILRSNTKVQLAVGENDKISACNQVEKLHTSLNLDNNVLIYEGCGHAVLNEHPAQWRKDALAFLNDV